MLFAWDDTNCEHIAKHEVDPEEAEEVVRGASRPFPRAMGDDKFMVWGTTHVGRYLQVIYVYKRPEDVDFESLSLADWAELEAESVARVIRVIHAIELTDDKRRKYRKLRRKHG
jgi:hypothetical protein